MKIPVNRPLLDGNEGKYWLYVFRKKCYDYIISKLKLSNNSNREYRSSNANKYIGEGYFTLISQILNTKIVIYKLRENRQNIQTQTVYSILNKSKINSSFKSEYGSGEKTIYLITYEDYPHYDILEIK
jgi:hypothetical protein